MSAHTVSGLVFVQFYFRPSLGAKQQKHQSGLFHQILCFQSLKLQELLRLAKSLLLFFIISALSIMLCEPILILESDILL